MISVDSVRPEMGLFDEPIMPDEIAGHRGEEEPDDQHDDGSHDPGRIGPTSTHTGAIISDEDDADHRKTSLELIYRSVLPILRGGAPSPRLGERAAESAESSCASGECVRGAHQHAADGDGTDDEAPYGARTGRPTIAHGVGRQEGLDLGSKEEHEKRNHQTPGEHATGELGGRRDRGPMM